MNKTLGLILIVILLLLGITGYLVYRVTFAPQPEEIASEEPSKILPPVDESVSVSLSKSKTKANTVLLLVSGMKGNMKTVAYELTYESGGLVKGVNSGSTPLDVSSKDEFEREVYLGTCSRNVCKPDLGVTKVIVVLEFTNVNNEKSQFSKEFEI